VRLQLTGKDAEAEQASGTGSYEVSLGGGKADFDSNGEVRKNI